MWQQREHGPAADASSRSRTGGTIFLTLLALLSPTRKIMDAQKRSAIILRDEGTLLDLRKGQTHSPISLSSQISLRSSLNSSLRGFFLK